jgi:hypothetical protein
MAKRLNLLTATVLALASAAGGAASASAASAPIPFRASFSGSAAIASPVLTTFAGAGIATQMGTVSTRGHADITGPDPSCPGGVANINYETLTAANGDTLTIRSQDVACPTGPGQYHGSGLWSVIGGTGRFSETTGKGSYDGSADFAAGTFTINLTGTLTLANAA